MEEMSHKHKVELSNLKIRFVVMDYDYSGYTCKLQDSYIVFYMYVILLYTTADCTLNFSLMKNKGDLERECDELKAELDNYNNKVQVLERTVEHLKKTIDEKVIRTVNSFVYKHINLFTPRSDQYALTYPSLPFVRRPRRLRPPGNHNFHEIFPEHTYTVLSFHSSGMTILSVLLSHHALVRPGQVQYRRLGLCCFKPRTFQSSLLSVIKRYQS